MFIAQLLFRGHLEEKEKIKFIAHKHIFTIVRALTKIIFIGLIAPAVFFLLAPFPPFNYISYIWMLIGVIKFLYVLADWYFDAWLITNMGIIQVFWNGFFDKTETRIEYQAIKGVSYKIKGVLGTIFNYGDIYVEIYAANTLLTLPHALNPKRIQRAVINAQEEFIEKKTFEDHETLKEMLAGMIQTQRQYKKER